MLTRFHKILIGLLVVQLLLVVLVMTRSDDAAGLKEHALLAGFDADKVTRVQVFSSAEAKPLDLVKREASWVLASGFDYPVEASRVKDVLTPIAKLRAAAPLATQAARYKQLRVADADFERKLVITAGGKDVTLFIGSSAGPRRSALRIADDDGVYAVTGLSAQTASADAHQWVDPVYLKVPSEDIAQVVVQRDGKSVALARVAAPVAAGSGSGLGSGTGAGSGSGVGSATPAVPDHWTATIAGAPITLATGESLDEAAIAQLISKVATIDVTAPGDPKRDASKPTATITVERKASGSTSQPPIVIDVIADASSYWVHDRSSPRAAMVDKNRLDDVLGVERDKLIKKPPPPPPAATAAPGAGSGSAARSPAPRPPAGATVPRPG